MHIIHIFAKFTLHIVAWNVLTFKKRQQTLTGHLSALQMRSTQNNMFVCVCVSLIQ